MVKVASQSRYCHSQGGVIKTFSPPEKTFIENCLFITHGGVANGRRCLEAVVASRWVRKGSGADALQQLPFDGGERLGAPCEKDDTVQYYVGQN